MNLEFKEINKKDVQHTGVKFEFKHIELKEDDNVAIIEGIANQVGIIDWGLDYTEPGAFDATVKEQPVVPALYGHMTRELPIGLNFLSLADDKSLLTRLELNLEVQSAKELYAILKQYHKNGRPFELSIGYLIVEADIEERKGVMCRVLKQVQVEEVSLVVFGMNQGSQVTDVKNKEFKAKIVKLEKSNEEKDTRIQELEKQLVESKKEIGLLESKIKTQKLLGGNYE